MRDTSFKSTGTIRVRFGATMNGAKSGKKGHRSPPQLTKRIFFIPSNHLTVRSGGEHYAVSRSYPC